MKANLREPVSEVIAKLCLIDQMNHMFRIRAEMTARRLEQLEKESKEFVQKTNQINWKNEGF